VRSLAANFCRSGTRAISGTAKVREYHRWCTSSIRRDLGCIDKRNGLADVGSKFGRKAIVRVLAGDSGSGGFASHKEDARSQVTQLRQSTRQQIRDAGVSCAFSICGGSTNRIHFRWGVSQRVEIPVSPNSPTPDKPKTRDPGNFPCHARADQRKPRSPFFHSNNVILPSAFCAYSNLLPM